MRSLFILALPRSLTTIVYHAARRSLDLHEPSWTTDGEILNADRVVFSGSGDDLKFVLSRNNPRVFSSMKAFLDDVVKPEWYAYKEVVNPFVTAEWLRAHDFAVLKIRRDLAGVAMAMSSRGWLYPTRAASEGTADDERLIEGLAMAWRTIQDVPGVTIDYDALVHDESVLDDALRRLYPGRDIQPACYITAGFAATRQILAGQRRSDAYQRFARLTERYASA